MRYFSTFITGLQKPVEQALKGELVDVQISQLLDGLVIYETAAEQEKVKSLRFLNNTFILIKKYTSASLETMVKDILADPQLEESLTSIIPKKVLSFRIVTSRENEFVPIEKGLINSLEQLVSQLTRLQVNRANPNSEFWFYQRREGLGLFGLRLTRHTAYDKILAKGELRPELAHLLNLLSQPTAGDIFLDPFTGSGAIPIERAKQAPCQKILAGDIKPETVNRLRQRVKKAHLPLVVGRWDATSLRTFTNNSVSKIVTDPPWGVTVGKTLDLTTFYSKMIAEFIRVLTPGGLLVVLVANKGLFEAVLDSYQAQLTQLKQYDTLVNGQKAAIYKLERI